MINVNINRRVKEEIELERIIGMEMFMEMTHYAL